MSDTTNHRALYDEIRDSACVRYSSGYQIREISSEQAGRLVERVAAMDCGDPVCEGLLGDSIKLLARVLPQDEHFSTRLTTLFNRAAPIGSSNVRDLMRDLFYRNPDVLADPLIAFVCWAPMGERQTQLLRDIFHPTSLWRDAVECFPPKSYNRKAQGLRRAAVGMDELCKQKGFLAIVENIIAFVESQRAASMHYRGLFHS